MEGRRARVAGREAVGHLDVGRVVLGHEDGVAPGHRESAAHGRGGRVLLEGHRELAGAVGAPGTLANRAFSRRVTRSVVSPS